jgi:hypothetical protein
MFSFIIILIAHSNGGGASGGTSSITGITDDAEPSVTTLAPIETMRPPQQQSVTSAYATYIMNDITGKLFEVVKNSSAYRNLTFKDEHEFSDEIPRGVIFWQSIEREESYVAGAEIVVKVSKGPRFVPVPEHIGLQKKDYFALLNAAGIKYEEREFETDSVLSGYVVKLGAVSDGKETAKEPGDTIDAEKGETLIVYIALNPPEPETTAATTRAPTPTFIFGGTTPFYVTDEPDITGITFFD